MNNILTSNFLFNLTYPHILFFKDNTKFKIFILSFLFLLGIIFSFYFNFLLASIFLFFPLIVLISYPYNCLWDDDILSIPKNKRFLFSKYQIIVKDNFELIIKSLLKSENYTTWNIDNGYFTIIEYNNSLIKSTSKFYTKYDYFDISLFDSYSFTNPYNQDVLNLKLLINFKTKEDFDKFKTILVLERLKD